MKILVQLFLVLWAITPLSAQTDILCPDIACGLLNASFDTDGAVVFCEGETITLNNLSDQGFDFFIVDWQDGTIDTVANYDPISHTYIDIFQDSCEMGLSFAVAFRGILECDAGFSCASGTYDFSLRPPAQALFGIDSSQVCAGEPVPFTNLSCNATDYVWDFGDGQDTDQENPDHEFEMPGTYIVTLTATGFCSSDSLSFPLEVVAPVTPVIDATNLGSDSLICVDGELTFINESLGTDELTWSIQPGAGDTSVWCFTEPGMSTTSDLINVRFKQAGNYSITLRGNNACGSGQNVINVQVEDAPAINLQAPPEGCEQLVVSPADLGFAINGNVQDVSWSFTNANLTEFQGEDFGAVTFNQSGTISLSITGSCGVFEQTVDAIVQPRQAPQLLADPTYCSGSSVSTLVADLPGGSWSGPGIIDATQGLFDPGEAMVGNNTIRYILATGACLDTSSIDIEIIQSESVSIQDETACEDAGSFQLNFSPTGGNWSGPGISDPALGVFDPALVNPGIIRPLYTYLDANGCSVETRPEIEIVALPISNTINNALVCLVDTLLSLEDLGISDISPAGGTFVWTSAGQTLPSDLINPLLDLGAVGSYQYNFSYELGPCTITDSFLLEVNEDPPLILTPQPAICINDGSLQLTANLPGGSWSGPGIDPQTGIINLAAAGNGEQTYTYVYAADNSCIQRASQTIDIDDPSLIVGPGPQQEICEGVAETITLVGASPPGGSWSGPGIIDPQAGLIDLNLLTPGQTYDYDYTYESTNATDCPATAGKTLTYLPRPDPTYSIDGGACLGDSFTLIPNENDANFNYSWNLGDETTFDIISPSHTYASTGVYLQTFTITSPDGCTASSTRTVSVIDEPLPAFSLDEDDGCAPFQLSINDESIGQDIIRLWCIGNDTVNGAAPTDYIIDGLTEASWIPITLKTSNQCGTTMASDSVLVHPYPRVNFGFETPNGCSPFTPAISNVTVGSPDQYFWDMGNGVTGIDSLPPLVTYTTPPDEVTSYPVSLIAFNECGTDTLVRMINVFPPDVEAFISLDTIAGCPPYQLQPESFSTPGAVLSWEVYSPSNELIGTAASLQPNFDITEPGIYTIILEAARCGADQDTAYFELYPTPEISFENDPSGCQDALINFSDTSPQTAGVFWEFGDGNNSDQVNAQHAYDAPGTYDVNLTIFAPLTGCPATATGSVEVLPLPNVTFSVPEDNGCGPLQVNFENGTALSDSLEYFWEFGDGSNPSREFAPQHTYQNSGSYSVQLSVTDMNGCVNVETFDSVVVHPDPVAAFSFVDSSLCLGYDQLEIINQSSDVSSAFWTLENIVYPGQPPVLAADSLGSFAAILMVESFFGCRDTSRREYVVLPSPQGAIELTPAEVCLGEPISFTAITEDADIFLWNLGDQTGSTATALVHYYPEAGDFNVQLVAGNSNGCPGDTATASVRIRPKPLAAFTTSLEPICGTPAEVQTQNNSQDALSYSWNYGDGRSSSQLQPTILYDSIGFYPIELVATSDFGCQDTTQQTVQVRGMPVADFDPPPVQACSPYRLQLNASPTQATRYEWFINGSRTGQVGQILDTLLTSPGNYDVRLVASFDNLCQDTLSRFNLFELQPIPIADFDFDEDPLPNEPGDVRFVNLSADANDYFWDFGDGNSSTEIGPLHQYAEIGPKLVTLTAFARYPGGLVCRDSISQEILPAWLNNFFVPTAMAPEAIGGEFRDFGVKGVGVQEYVLEVFSPFGQLLFQTSELEDDQPVGRWDGTYPNSNELVLQGAYTWRARVIYVNGNIENLVGTVTVIR